MKLTHRCDYHFDTFVNHTPCMMAIIPLKQTIFEFHIHCHYILQSCTLKIWLHSQSSPSAFLKREAARGVVLKSLRIGRRDEQIAQVETVHIMNSVVRKNVAAKCSSKLWQVLRFYKTSLSPDDVVQKIPIPDLSTVLQYQPLAVQVF